MRPVVLLISASLSFVLLGAELAIPVLERSPQIPTGDGTVGTPLRADFSDVLRRRSLAFSIRAPDGVLDAKVELRQYVAAVEAEHQEHLRGPPPDAFDLNKVCNEIVVVHTFDRVEWQRAAHDLGREIPHVGDFLSGEADRAQLGVARGENGVGSWRVIGVERVESREDRRRGFAR